MLRAVWYIFGFALVLAEVGLHFADYHIPLQGGYALFTAADDPTICGLTYNSMQIVERLTKYEDLGSGVVLLQIADDNYAIARDGVVDRYDDVKSWREAVADEPGNQGPALRAPSRFQDPDYRVVQTALVLCFAVWGVSGLLIKKRTG